eukprot:702251-Pyramimonas_sp.AAC.1
MHIPLCPACRGATLSAAMWGGVSYRGARRVALWCRTAWNWRATYCARTPPTRTQANNSSARTVCDGYKFQHASRMDKSTAAVASLFNVLVPAERSLSGIFWNLCTLIGQYAGVLPGIVIPAKRAHLPAAALPYGIHSLPKAFA